MRTRGQLWAIASFVALGACGRCDEAAPRTDDEEGREPELHSQGTAEAQDDPLESGDDLPADPAADPMAAHGWTQAHLEALLRYAQSCTTLSKQAIDLHFSNDLFRKPQLRAAVLDPPRKLMRVGSEGRDFEATQIAVPPLERSVPNVRGRAIVVGLLESQLSSAQLQDCDSRRLDGVPFGRVYVRGARIEWIAPPPADERVEAYARSCKGPGRSVSDAEWADADRLRATRIRMAAPAHYKEAPPRSAGAVPLTVGSESLTATEVLIPFDAAQPSTRLLVSTVGDYLAFEGCDPSLLDAAR